MEITITLPNDFNNFSQVEQLKILSTKIENIAPPPIFQISGLNLLRKCKKKIF